MIAPLALPLADARRIWLRAQRLDTRAPFGAGPEATQAAVEHLGYVQIDTINVIERCHHHILFSRIPDYRCSDLAHAQSTAKTVFEYWTHALSYVPVRDFRFFVPAMKAHRAEPSQWSARTPADEVRRILRTIRRDGALSIRDVDDEVLLDKDHPWASRKPSKGALQRAFYDGRLAISARSGMVKTYELMERHFGWRSLPRAATPAQIAEYRLDRAIRAQGIISAPSVMYPWKRFSPEVERLVARRVRRGDLVPVALEGSDLPHWVASDMLDTPPAPEATMVHILSPFDPLIIQRARLKLFFGYDHLFEAYLPREKRRYGYFALPVLVDDTVVAVIDLKTDRQNRSLLVQHWTWTEQGSARRHKRLVEEELHRFEAFQLAP